MLMIIGWCVFSLGFDVKGYLSFLYSFLILIGIIVAISVYLLIAMKKETERRNKEIEFSKLATTLNEIKNRK